MRPRSKRCNCQRRGDGWRLPLGCWTHEGLSFQNRQQIITESVTHFPQLKIANSTNNCLLFCLHLGDGGGSKRGCCGCCLFKTGASNQYFLSNLKSSEKGKQKTNLIPFNYLQFTLSRPRSVRCLAGRSAWSFVVATLIQRNFLGILSSQPHLVYDPRWDHKIHRNLLEFVLETKLI